MERIHTFSLKEPNEDLDKSDDQISNSYQGKSKMPVEGALGEIPAMSDKERSTRNQAIKRNS